MGRKKGKTSRVPRGLRKHIRMQKARIRAAEPDREARDRLIAELYARLNVVS